MSTSASHPSPLVLARIAGAIAVVLLVLGPFSLMVVPSMIVVPGDAAASAHNLAAHGALLRLGLLGELGIATVEIAMVVVLYLLFRPVSEALAGVAALARAAMAVVQGVNVVPGLAALSLVNATTGDGSELALACLEAREHGALVWQAFFGVHCAVLGVLVYRSRFLPRVLGALMIVAAAGYLLDSAGTLLAPAHADAYALIVGVAALIGELPFLAWLLIKGVDVERWRAVAARAPRRDDVGGSLAAIAETSPG